MEKFMLIFRNEESQTGFRPSPEEIQAEMEKWNNWLGGLAAQGKMAGAEALLPFGTVVTGAKNVVTDGPFVEGKEIVGGYTIVLADSLDEAVELSKGCPIYDVEGSVEVRQVMKFD